MPTWPMHLSLRRSSPDSTVSNVHVQGIAWFPEKEKALLEALHRWAVVLPHMMLFHCCEGFDMESMLKVYPREQDT